MKYIHVLLSFIDISLKVLKKTVVVCYEEVSCQCLFNGCVHYKLHMERVVQLGEVFIFGGFPLEFKRRKLSSW